MLDVILAVVIGATLLWTASSAWPSLRAIWLARKLPGPTLVDLPLIGNFNKFVPRTQEEAFNRLREMSDTYGTVTGYRVFHQIFVGITNPVDAQIVLMHPRVKNRDIFSNQATKGFLKDSILDMKDDEAVFRRKLMAPTVHFKILMSYLETFGRKADEFAERLTGVADGRNVNINKHLRLRSGCGPEEIMNIGLMINQAIELMMKRSTNPYLWPEWIYALTANGRREKSITEEINKFVYKQLAKAVETIAKSSAAERPVTAAEAKKPKSYSDIVLQTAFDEGTHLPTNSIRGDIAAFLVAGTDTSASTMSYVLILLGMHPDWQERVVNEQRDIFQDSLRPANSDDLSKMTLLDITVKEALRLFPPVSVLPREIPVDIQISNGYVVPAGCYAYIGGCMMQRDARNYVDPERFWPERWLPENSVGRHPFAFLPFGVGGRNCIGQKYAQLQMKVTLSRVLRQFRFACEYTMDELSRIELGSMNRSVVGYDVQISPR